MELQIKTPVQVVQELIAIHTTRIEAGERLQENGPEAALSDRLHVAVEQSKQFTHELMEELSNFGDAVQADVDRENTYQAIWKKALQNNGTMDASEVEPTFGSMEIALKENYQQYLDTETELPESIQALLVKQAGML